MKRTDDNYIGRFKVKALAPKPDGFAECELVHIERPDFTMQLGSVEPTSMKNVIHVDAWKDGLTIELELVMQDGTKHTSYIQGQGMA